MTRKRRYSKVISDLGMVGLGNPISGLHVHVEVPEPDQRVEIMHRLVPFLPLLLARSTSSPFWCGYQPDCWATATPRTTPCRGPASRRCFATLLNTRPM
ncbi:glutamate-cysteine ligase family protein [Bradyrhizobium sp. LLZ17]|uniref:Glutamate-cysteine ligase family protein n=1 Tax=Bradyrhizobium sp. LLZ17 TaxID=3239388 RepID=A0AB39XMI8_9BRAD